MMSIGLAFSGGRDRGISSAGAWNALANIYPQYQQYLEVVLDMAFVDKCQRKVVLPYLQKKRDNGRTH